METEQEYYEQRNLAVHSGAHTLAVAATDVFEDARETVAAFIGAQINELVWTANATAGLNLNPRQELCCRTGATLRFIPIHDDGTLDLDAAATLMNLKSKVLAFTHVSNVTGVFNLVAELTAVAHNAGALVVLDACQSAPHLPLDVKALDVDFAVFRPQDAGSHRHWRRLWPRRTAQCHAPVPDRRLHDHHRHQGGGRLPAICPAL